MIGKLQSLLGSPAKPTAAVAAAHEKIDYAGGQITMQFRLLPQHQDALEAALVGLEKTRTGNVTQATTKFTDAVRVAREAFERSRADATAERDKAINAAHAAYEAAHRKLLLQYGRAPTPEELAVAKTKPGQVIDLRNVAPAGA